MVTKNDKSGSDSNIDSRVKKLASRVMDLYSTGGGEQKANIIRNYYRPDALFDDPAVRVRGEWNILRQFFALSRMFYAIDVQYTVQSWPVVIALNGDKNNGISKRALVSISSQQDYYATRFCMRVGKPIRLQVQTVLRIDLDNMQVEWHRDKWIGHRFLGNQLRSLIGLLTCALFSIVWPLQ
jgi:hypothetical protein